MAGFTSISACSTTTSKSSGYSERRSILLTKATGRRPVGYRAPSWAMSRYTMKQVKEAGFLYDSSLMPATTRTR